MPNHLSGETSPYLLEHVGNPVDWYPWGDEALEKAHREDKPIFLSIGYAACHWCHVMARESFENSEIADRLNAHFVSIKVDREERPDLDAIFMSAVTAVAGQGGWPMSVFLSPDGRPFYGGTYYPPTPRYGMPSFSQVLDGIIETWQSDRQQITELGSQLAGHVQKNLAWAGKSQQLQRTWLTQAASTLLDSYDWQNGGWGGAPKFPNAMAIEFLLTQTTRGNQDALSAAVHALRSMAQGGIYDAVGGGFHRYTVDATWTVPHFEKMLYDNALLARAYLHAYQLTGSPDFRYVCESTLDFIARELCGPEGGFYSSLDADSNGIEGEFYVWTAEEIKRAISSAADTEFFFRLYPVTAQGNFEGKNVLRQGASNTSLEDRLKLPAEEIYPTLGRIAADLRQARERRARPRTDDKVLVGWNALALQAFAEAARALDRQDYLTVATRNAAFLLSHLVSDNRLIHSWRGKPAHQTAFLQDYAGLTLALLTLYQVDFDPSWFIQARSLITELRTAFPDPQGGFFDTRSDQPVVLTRPKEIQDNATPSGNAQAALALLTLAELDEDAPLREAAEQILGTIQTIAARYPTAMGAWLTALDFAFGPIRQVAVVGDLGEAATRALLSAGAQNYRPRTVWAASHLPLPPGSPALLNARPLRNNLPTAYVCYNFSCKLPVNTVAELQNQLAENLSPDIDHLA